MNTFRRILFFSLLFTAFSGLLRAQHSVMIAISKGTSSDSYLAYGHWLKAIDPQVEWIDMSSYQRDSALILLERCSGLLLSGGEDVYPGKYGREADTARCDVPDLNRDTLEFALIGKAAELGIPVLGICRGLQILNVAYGGSLIIDIPADLSSSIHQCADKYACFHEVTLSPGSMIHRISGLQAGTTNTNHHQGIERLAAVFRPTGRTKDMIIEVIEWDEPEGKPYLLGIHWHPERMDLTNPLSGTIGLSFIEAVKTYHKTHIN